jgi:DNA repair photolyase
VRIHECFLKGDAIKRTPAFEEKGLAQFAVNVGLKCSHGCTYCSTGTMLRMHTAFREAGENPFEHGYAMVDTAMPERVAVAARSRRSRGLIQLCTTVDAWAEEARRHDLGRRCLQAMLNEPGWSVRVLTKNAAVAKDFDLISKHRDRVLVGLSLTAPPSKSAIMQVVEPNASPIQERMAALREAHAMGLRTYAMLCPLLPGISDDEKSISELVDFALSCGAEEFFAEPVNSRGPGLRLTHQALEAAGYHAEAEAVGAIRREKSWSSYVVRLLGTLQRVLGERGQTEKLRFLLYPTGLTPADLALVRENDTGVKWLGPSRRR